MQITTQVEDFLQGKWPKCKLNPQGVHVKVAGMHIKKPYCLHCGKDLTKYDRSD